ncbi:MAG: sigma-70 family RNA polymerase sigma factor [Myxococcota bacterium]
MIPRLATVVDLGLLAADAPAADYSPPRGRAHPMASALNIEELYRRYGDMVYGRCRSLLHNDADAQEACQEVFLRVWRYRDGFRGDASPSTYLFKVTTTTCLNRLRTKRRRPEEPVEDIAALGPRTVAGDTMLHAVELRKVLEAVLGEEDERTVQCVVYHYVDGLTHDEVGQLLGVTGAAVRKRISTFRARAAQSFPGLVEEEP